MHNWRPASNSQPPRCTRSSGHGNGRALNPHLLTESPGLQAFMHVFANLVFQSGSLATGSCNPWLIIKWLLTSICGGSEGKINYK